MPKEKPQIKNIFLDLGNVLIYHDAKIAAKKISKLTGISIPQLWAHFFTSGIEKKYTRGEFSSYEFYHRIRDKFKLTIPYAEFREIWNDIFWEVEGMEALVKKLKKKYRLFVISNTNAMHWKYILDNYTVLSHFIKLFPSHLVGMRKPDTSIYKVALRRAGAKPEESVFTDDIPAFIKGAKKVGMHGIVFKNKSQFIRDLKRLGVEV